MSSSLIIHSRTILYLYLLSYFSSVTPTQNNVNPLDFTSSTSSAYYNAPSIISEALGDRLKSVYARTLPQSWSVNTTPALSDSVAVGVILNTAEAFKSVLFGPDPEQIESQRFKEIWGEKSEIRRFKDGSIRHCVVSQASSFPEKFNITPEFISYLLESHFGSVRRIQAGLFQKILGQVDVHYMPGLFLKLKKVLQAIELPIMIEDVLPLSAGLRYTAVRSIKDDIRQSILIEFEHTTRWPDNLEAIREMKCALYARISKLLQEQNISSNIRLGNAPSLEIEFEGHLFDCKIVSPREGHLLSETNPEKHEIYLRENTIEPDLSARISNICVENHVLSCTIRLVKRWVYAHLLSLVPELFIESLVIIVLNQQQYEATGSVYSGFMRVLKFLSEYKWEEPLTMFFQNENDKERNEVKSRVFEEFEKSRRGKTVDKFMFIGSSSDKTCSVFSKGNSQVIAKRIQTLAKATFAAFKNGPVLVCL